MKTDEKKHKSKKAWSKRSILKAIKNPSSLGYEIKIKTSEFSCIGSPNQPDFADVYLVMYPKNKVIELRSLKLYFHDFRNRHISYERVINTIYDDLVAVYEPKRLRIVMIFNPRGGLSSKLAIDSDWKIRGGKEKFKDWIGQEDVWANV